MKFKKNCAFVFLCVKFFSSPLYSFSSGKNYDPKFETESDMMLFEDVDDDIPTSEEKNSSSSKRGGFFSRSVFPTVSPADLATLLPLLVTTPIWGKTAPKHTRNLIDLLPYKDRFFENKSDINLYFFFNATNKLPVTVGDTFNLTSLSPFAQTLLFNWLEIEDPADAARLLPLVKNISVEERNVGAMITAYFKAGVLLFEGILPVGFSERNLITSNKDKDAISALVQNKFGTSTNFDENREFARLMVGIGDLRIKCGLRALDVDDFKLNVGLSTIIPTASGFELDGRFKKPASHPTLVTQPGVDVDSLLESVRSLLLKPELGNNGHPALGLYAESLFEFFDKKYTWWNTISFDYLFSAEERRLVSDALTLSPKQLDPLNPDINLISAFERQYVVPRNLKVKVRPGNVFIYSGCFERVWSSLRVGLGYNFYLSEREEFEKIEDRTVDIADLKIESATADPVIQQKIFGELSYRSSKALMPLTLGVGGDYTFAHNKGASNDWTAYAKLCWSF